ncbi:MAG TPA: TIGR02996 domain-containing protein [Gemmata sp.]|nr:TIGR02996 domain-containing protein [Gemmata sp.]
MSDHDALLAAICAEPDDDTPRLVFADWLEENDQVDRAAFVRAQVELARTPPWEPFAAFCRWRRPEWSSGKPFRDTLPPLAGSAVEWHPQAFRRGLPWRLNVRSLVAWEKVAPGVLERAPVGEVQFWGADTLDQWHEFAATPLVSRLRVVHLMTRPVEPLIVLRDAPAALGIEDVHFERATGAGIAFVVQDLLASPLGRTVRGLHFHMGYESLDDLIEELERAHRLERLSLALMGLTEHHVRRMCDGPLVGTLSELSLRGNPLGSAGVHVFAASLTTPSLHTLDLSGTGTAGFGLEALTSTPGAVGLRRLDLSCNPLSPRAARLLSRSPHLAGLRSVNLSKSRVGERELFHLTRAKFWGNLAELDLRDNPLSRPGVRHLLDAAVPDDLAALVLTGDQLGAESRRELRNKYGERVVFATG